MFNVTVLKMKDIVRVIIGLGITIIAVLAVSKTFNKDVKNEEKIVQGIQNKIQAFYEQNSFKCIDQTIPAISTINNEYKNIANEDDQKEENNIFKTILETQISSVKGIGKIENKQEKTEEDAKQEENETPKQEEIIIANTSNLETKVTTNNPIADNYNVEYGKVKIKNQTDYQLTNEMLKPDITIENKNILLFHTHSCESYTASEGYEYASTGNFRTTDLNFSVTRVGSTLEEQLKQYNYNVIHNTSYHDYPSYNGAYTRSLATVENILKTEKADIIIDVHRDAIGNRSDYAPTVKIGNEDVAAQLMFVIGTNAGGLWHPNWNQNLKFAIKVQEKAEEMYPGLFKSIMLTKSRYNQHTRQICKYNRSWSNWKHSSTMFN